MPALLSRLPVVILALILGVAIAPPATALDRAVTTCHRTLEHYPVLDPGDRGPAVATLQCTLNDLGVGPVSVDGYYGPQTTAAVARVEARFEGVPAHPGRIEAGYWVLLFGGQLRKVPRQGDHGHDVRVLQRALRAAGYAITVDGDYGTQTRTVVLAYRERFGNPSFCLHNGCALGGG